MTGIILSGKEILKKIQKREWPRSYVRKKGNKYYIRNSVGHWIEMKQNKLYYHRGKGRFADYGIHRDGLKHAKTVVHDRRHMNQGDLPHKTKVGKKKLWL